MENSNQEPELALELQILREITRHLDHQVIWSPAALGTFGYGLANGTWVARHDWHRALLELKRQGLVKRVRKARSSLSRATKTLTCYALSPKGEKILKELGLWT